MWHAAMGYNEQPDQLCCMAETYIKEKKPNFVAVCFDQLDHVGHVDGHDTPAYYRMLNTLDGYVARIIAALKDAGIYDDTIIILTSDHGGINKGHGGITLAEMEIPFIIAGKNVKQGGAFQETMMQFDTASTIACIFGLKQPQAWIGRPMTRYSANKKRKTLITSLFKLLYMAIWTGFFTLRNTCGSFHHRFPMNY